MNPGYTGCRRTADGGLVPGWVPIVDMEIHRAAVAVLSDVARSSRRPGRQERLLSYLATCAACGDQLGGGKDHAGRPQYRCPVNGCIHVSQEWLDGLVTGLLCARLARPDAGELYRGNDEEAERFHAKATKLRAQLDEWLKAALEPHEYQVKKDQLLPQIRKAERAAAAAGSPLVLRGLLAADDVRGAWDHLDIPARRAVIRALAGVSVAKAESRTRAARTDPGRVIISWVRG